MKISLKVIGLFLTISFSTFAQNGKKIRIGPHLGLSMAQVSQLESGEKAIFRPTFGIAVDVKTGPHVTFSTGLTHMTLGESQILNSYPSESKYVNVYQTLMVPLTFKIHP